MRFFAAYAYVASLGLAFAQQPPDGPKFEVASIKLFDPNAQNTMFIGMSADGAMVNYTNITLFDCIRGAYRVRDFQITGPDWMTKASFAISAKLPLNASSDQIPEMLQALLADRFELEIRREMREQNVYVLSVGNGGAKLKPAEAKPDDNAPKVLGPDGQPRALDDVRGAARRYVHRRSFREPRQPRRPDVTLHSPPCGRHDRHPRSIRFQAALRPGDQ